MYERVNGPLPDVGLFVDDERSIAALSRPMSSNPSLHVASLHSTVLYIHSDGSASLGGSDDPDAAMFSGFVGGEPPTSGHRPAELVAMTFRCLLGEVALSLRTDVESLAAAATFPTSWDADEVSELRMAMNRFGLDRVALVSESEALNAWSESTLATWAGSDSGIAAARGSARLASSYPVDAVTEEFAVARPTRPIWTRTPVLAAAAFAALLTLGAGVTALALQDSSAPTVPTIEDGPIAAPTTSTPRPTNVVPFPTADPIAEAPVVPQTWEEPTPEPALEPTIDPVATTPPSTEAAAVPTPTTERTESRTPDDEPSSDETVPEETAETDIPEDEGGATPEELPEVAPAGETATARTIPTS